jgi:hypothetical protein
LSRHCPRRESWPDTARPRSYPSRGQCGVVLDTGRDRVRLTCTRCSEIVPRGLSSSTSSIALTPSAARDHVVHNRHAPRFRLALREEFTPISNSSGSTLKDTYPRPPSKPRSGKALPPRSSRSSAGTPEREQVELDLLAAEHHEHDLAPPDVSLRPLAPSRGHPVPPFPRVMRPRGSKVAQSTRQAAPFHGKPAIPRNLGPKGGLLTCRLLSGEGESDGLSQGGMECGQSEWGEDASPSDGTMAWFCFVLR